MNRRVLVSASIIMLSCIFCIQVFAQSATSQRGTVVIPSSSIEKPGDLGLRAHTNVRQFIPADGFQSAQPQAAGGPPYSGYFIETPESVACVYALTKPVKGCSPNNTTAALAGGSKAIAIVDAYDAPNAANDLAAFSTQFGLPAATFQVVYASGSRPPYSSGWEVEESLDVQWAHAMAPNAKLYLVEAASSQFSDLFAAVQSASNLVAKAGGGEVSMSWGGSEFSGENAYDTYFTTSGVVYLAASGDAVTTQYPAVSPNVIAVGGTSFSRNAKTGAFEKEFAWQSSGVGPSSEESRPSYQSVISKTVGSARGVPDVSALADPMNSVWVYVSDQGGWGAVGGTSAASPTWAGIVNRAGSFAQTTNAELTTIYDDLSVATNYEADFNDIKLGYCSIYNEYAGVKGWDFCTGVGSPKGYSGK